MTTFSSPADVAELIGKQRLSRGWTMERLANEVDVSHCYASLICSGKRTPHVPMLISILDRLGYDLVAVKR